ncbi:MAG: 4Fe-4S binding protein [Deltaproteobacteria bacterium]|nr:4Fe-4S binding protein [Deltaproteobacteria bacterium]MBW2100603.1 4Fe-4S binding protein [Deltaproteobacteria bacterium]
MGDYCIYTDPEKCIACHACEVQCKVKNNVPRGANLGQLVIMGPKLVNGVPKMSSVFIPCFQCENAWCVNACPTGAIRRREKDGIIYIVEELCVGCKACILACPWKIPQWNSKTGKVIKCDMCMDRIDEGKIPACVAACPTNALQFGRPETISSQTREAYGLNLLEKNLVG